MFCIQRCDRKHMESDAPVALYYERLAAVQLRGCQVTHQVLRDILREVQGTMVPEVLLKQWAQYTYQDATDYWTFRKQVCSIFPFLLLDRRSCIGSYWLESIINCSVPNIILKAIVHFYKSLIRQDFPDASIMLCRLWIIYNSWLLFHCFIPQFTIQLALIGFAEFTLHLTRLGPEMLQVVQDSGRVTVAYFRFEVDDSKGKNVCLDSFVLFILRVDFSLLSFVPQCKQSTQWVTNQGATNQ